MPLVQTNRLHKFFGKNHVLKGIKLDVEEGEVVTIVGRSGSGKSTLLRTLNGLEHIDDGTIEVDGTALIAGEGDLRALRQKVGMVFQQFNLFPHLTAGQNVMLAPQVVKKTDKREAAEIARTMLARVGLDHKYDAYPDQLSGGQQQRVAIGRALITKPKLILADEPTGNLDSKNSQDVIDLLTKASRHYQQTILMITHNNGLTSMVDRVLRVTDGVLTDLGGNANEKLS